MAQGYLRTRSLRPLLGGLLAATLIAAVAPAGQAGSRLLRRWVGTHLARPLHLDFYGDTMLVVNDLHALDFEVRRDSLFAWGDTSFAVRFWFARDRLLVETAEGEVVTMAEQDVLARPLHGRWRGTTSGATSTQVELLMYRGGPAQWRRLPGGEWIQGEWNRQSRVITFTWLPDSTQWTGLHDPGANALVFDQTQEDLGTLILRHVYRW